MKIEKRDGSIVPFDKQKIINAINKAFLEVDGELYETDTAESIAEDIASATAGKATLTVEEIQDMVEEELMASERKDVARAYVRYRYKKEILRQTNKRYEDIIRLIDFKNKELEVENSNKNSTVASTQRDYMAGEVSKDITERYLLPQAVIDAHKNGEIHFHDADYFAQHLINCCLVNLEDMLQNGTVINKTLIERPHSFTTACNIATQIMAIMASEQYGGQSISVAHLAPFVDVSRQSIIKELRETMPELDEDRFNAIVEKRLLKEIEKGVQTMQYQINTLNTSNGQTPFVTLFIYLNEAHNEREKQDLKLVAEEIFKQRIQGTKNEKGVWITPTFPKLIYVLEEDNITEDSPYWDLTVLAAKCTAKRFVPDYISEKIMKELKLSTGETVGHGDCYPCMGCRSFLTPDRSLGGFDNVANARNYEVGKPKYYGRFNQGVVTINLVDVACSAKDEEDFWNILDKRLEICHLGLQTRHKRLEGTPAENAPLHWLYGGLARLEKHETIDKLLHGGYSTLSLGYAGLWECVYKMTGKTLLDKEGHDFGIKVMEALNAACKKWKAAEDIDYSLYGTPEIKMLDSMGAYLAISNEKIA